MSAGEDCDDRNVFNQCGSHFVSLCHLGCDASCGTSAGGAVSVVSGILGRSAGRKGRTFAEIASGEEVAMKQSGCKGENILGLDL